MKIGVIGAGAWGTALAVQAASRHDVTLLAHAATQASALAQTRQNASHLPGVALPTALRVAALDAASPPAADLIVLATPAAAVPAYLAAWADCRTPMAWLSKGLVTHDAKARLLHEVAADVAPLWPCGVLSGPSFAQEVAAAQPCALVAASAHSHVRDLLVQAFHGDALRVYANDDITGVEVGGAVKNVLAIATGLCDGLQLGLNARAALITRGLAEMARFGVALGARPDTFMGLSGLGDLVLTATGSLSRNRQVGLALATGQTLDQAVASLGHVAEGVRCAQAVAQRAKQLGVAMPITQAVCDLLSGQVSAAQAVAKLLARNAARE